jgi:uncharacterized protein (TIGR00251 family)
LLQEREDGVLISIKVTPKACHSKVCSWEGEHLKIRLAAIPEKGKANQALIRCLSMHLDIPKSQISILHGETSRIKHVLISNISMKDLRPKLSKY